MCWKVTFGHHLDINIWTVRNFWTRPGCFTKHTFGVWIRTQTFYFFDWNQDFYRPLNMSHRVTRNKDSSYVQMEGFKNWRLLISHEFGKEIFFLYCEINNPQIKFSVKNMSVASYSWAVIASKMCWKVTFGHHLNINFWTVTNCWTRT